MSSVSARLCESMEPTQGREQGGEEEGEGVVRRGRILNIRIPQVIPALHAMVLSRAVRF